MHILSEKGRGVYRESKTEKRTERHRYIERDTERQCFK